VSLYFDHDGLSLIKFGSYDKAALKDPNDFTVMRTVNEQEWKIKASDPNINGNSIQS